MLATNDEIRSTLMWFIQRNSKIIEPAKELPVTQLSDAQERAYSALNTFTLIYIKKFTNKGVVV